MLCPQVFFFFFFNDTATTEIYTLSLHDALPIYRLLHGVHGHGRRGLPPARDVGRVWHRSRSEEHTSELQSQSNLVCRLLLEKKKTQPFPMKPLSFTAPPPTRSAPATLSPRVSRV